MPCDSTIKTKLTDRNRIAEALKGIGYTVEDTDDNMVVGEMGSRRIRFSSGRDGFYASGDTRDLGKISKKYAEIGVRAWAKRAGYSITENDGTNVTLVNRRK